MFGRTLSLDEIAPWLLVAVAFVALALAFSARSALGLAMPLWEIEFGWPRSFVSFGGALALVVMALVAPVVGNLVDSLGPRLLLAAGTAIVGLGMVLVAVMDSAWLFLVAFGGVGALGFGTVAMHVVAPGIARVFTRNVGLATGIATSGATAGQLAVVPLLAVVLESVNWRWSFLALALGSFALVPCVLFVLRKAGSAAPVREQAPREPLRQRLGFLLRSPVFHVLFWSFVICGFTTTGVIETHLLPYAAACGFPPLPSATAYGVLSGVNLVGMILAGWLTDRMNRPLLLAVIYIARGLSFILLMYIAADIRLLFIFAVVFGLFDYSTVPPTASLVASHLGLRIMGLAMGLIAAGHALGGAVGAFLGGWLFDLFARYDWVWLMSIGLAVFAGLLVLLLRDSGGMRGAAQPAQA